MDPEWTLDSSFAFEGQHIAYRIMGEGAPVVMIHGTPFSSYVWRKIARELARDHKVYLFDLLGYGQSEKSAGQDVSLGVQNRVLSALLNHWQLVRPRIVAHDFGGATALRAHLIDGCNYEKLLLIDPVAIRPWGSPFVQHVRNHEEAFAGVPDYLQDAILSAYIRSALARPISDADLAPYLRPWTGSLGKPAFYRQIAQMDLKYTNEVQDRYSQIRCPVMLLWGVDDQWIPVEQGRKLAAMIPDRTFLEIPDSGHLMQEDAPEAIIAAACRFFGAA
jgi:pimeloyl-ACP methyl ester carboxylesterase